MSQQSYQTKFAHRPTYRYISAIKWVGVFGHALSSLSRLGT